MLRLSLFAVVSAVSVAAGIMLIYFGCWLISAEIIPQVVETGWSLEGSNLILNHDWKGNQLYFLAFLYCASGASLVAVGWRSASSLFGHLRELRNMRRRFVR
ncbi:MAG: hypothetical protein GY906_27235 [bacterium]|nr:hypothetical protein [bacterium]